MLDFNLEYYRAFYYVARLNSISKAADALFLSQPAVTRSIQKLEGGLNCSLFTRSKGMQLTHEGTVLFAQVSKAFDALLTGEKELSRIANFEAGKLEIAGTETALYSFLLLKITAFRTLYPQIKLHISDKSTFDTLHAIRSENADIGVVASPLTDVEDLKLLKVMEFQDIVISGAAFSHLRGRSLSTQELLEIPFIAVERSSGEHRHLELWMEEQGFLFEPEFTVRTPTMIIPFVQRDLAISVLPNLLVQEFLTSEKLFEIKTQRPMPKRQIYVVYRDSPHMPLVCRRFIEYLSSV